MTKFCWYFFFEVHTIKTEQTYFEGMTLCHYLRVASLAQRTKTKHDSKCKCITSTVTKAEIHLSNIFQCTTLDLAHLQNGIKRYKIQYFCFCYVKLLVGDRSEWLALPLHYNHQVPTFRYSMWPYKIHRQMCRYQKWSQYHCQFRLKLEVRFLVIIINEMDIRKNVTHRCHQ